MPDTNQITHQQAIHPAKIIQIMIQSGLLLNRASAAPTNAEARSIQARERFSSDPRFAFPIYSYLLWDFPLYLCPIGRGQVVATAPRQLFPDWATRATKLCAIKILCRTPGTVHDYYLLLKTCTRRPQHEVSEIPSNCLLRLKRKTKSSFSARM